MLWHQIEQDEREENGRHTESNVLANGLAQKHGVENNEERRRGERQSQHSSDSNAEVQDLDSTRRYSSPRP